MVGVDVHDVGSIRWSTAWASPSWYPHVWLDVVSSNLIQQGEGEVDEIPTTRQCGGGRYGEKPAELRQKFARSSMGGREGAASTRSSVTPHTSPPSYIDVGGCLGPSSTRYFQGIWSYPLILAAWAKGEWCTVPMWAYVTPLSSYGSSGTGGP